MNSIERDESGSGKAHCRVCKRAVSALPPPPPIEAFSHRARNAAAIEPFKRPVSFGWLTARPVRWSAPAFPKATFKPPRRWRTVTAIGVALLLAGGGAWWMTRPKAVALHGVASVMTPIKAGAGAAPAKAPTQALKTPLLSTLATVALIQPAVPAPAAKKRKARSASSGDASSAGSVPLSRPTDGHDPDLEVKCLAYPDSPACRPASARAEVTQEP